jgi:hypothetical protein
MAKPPRKKRLNLDVGCDAFGCRPRSNAPGKKGIPIFGGGSPSKTTKPVERYDWEVEKFPVGKSTDVPQTDVNLDIEEIGFNNNKKQLFKGSYQDAQRDNAMTAAAKSSGTFSPANFPRFQEESRASLVKGGADPRTISPTALPGEEKTISKAPLTKAQEQTLRFRMGPDYDISKDNKLASRTRYKTDPKTGERTAVRKLMYDGGTITDINLQTGRAKITDLTSGKTKYKETPEIKVEKKGLRRIAPMEESIVEEEGQADVTKDELRSAVQASKAKPYKKKRRRRNYAPGGRGKY